jgi:hypothetical protein
MKMWKFFKKVGILLGVIIAILTIAQFFFITPAKRAELHEAEEAKKRAAEAAAELLFEQQKVAFVKLYDDDHFSGTKITFTFGVNNENFHHVFGRDFDDKASSAQWSVPTGWRVVLYGDNTFKDTSKKFIMTNSGECVDLKREHGFGDKGSSLRWEKQ